MYRKLIKKKWKQYTTIYLIVSIVFYIIYLYIIKLTSCSSGNVGVFLYSCSILGGCVIFGGHGVHGQGDEYLLVKIIKVKIMSNVKYISTVHILRFS